ncbi:hypothetical protein BV25DRAFT_1828008 [Artomyces pyxidatus]|uniref:Uncharacterized protein n=1 Tax=Artomyces pyxidatus TaxID=48021 RepID=A0ACB8SVQ4_9AGAM|nr:hypothetical protein BV25DRAFT_1828008 [Artomyces pyxidatus]
MQPFLPIELLQAIVDDVPAAQDLRRVRAANRTLDALATARAFRTLNLTNTETSADGFLALLECRELVRHVEEVVYCDRTVDTGDDGRLMDEEYEESIRIKISDALKQLYELPNLRRLSVIFHPTYQEDEDDEAVPGRHALIQQSVFAALSSKHWLTTGRLTHVTFKNLTPMYPAVCTSSAFAALFSSVTDLHVSTASYPDEGTISNRWVSFWGYLPTALTAPGLSSHLTSLTIRGGAAVAHTAFFTFLGLSYPHLTTLTLENILFSPRVSAEDFIVRHGKRLAHLTLVTCKLPLQGSDDVPERPWARVWDRFASELGSLTRLEVVDENDPSTGAPLRYTMLSMNLFESYFVSPENDDAALLRFRVVVGSNRKHERVLEI